MTKNPNSKSGRSDRNSTNWKVKFKNVRGVAKNIASLAISDLAPGVTDTVSSSREAIRDASQFISKTKNQVNPKSLGSKARGIVKEAFDDLKNGTYGLDKAADMSFDMEDDFDADIRDYDSSITGSTDPETTAMFETKKNTAMLGKVIAHGNATTVSSLGQMSKTISNVTLKASQAQTAQLSNILIANMNTQSAYLGMIGGKLESINSNLVNIIEFNNNVAADFYRKSAEYQSNVLEMLHSFGETLTKMHDIAEYKQKEDEFDFSGGFNLSRYKDMVKKNFSSSMLGTASSFLGMAGSLGGNPLTMFMPQILGMLTPGPIKKTIGRFDKSFTQGMENLLYRIGDLQYSNSLFSPLGEFFGKKRKNISKLNMGDYRKDAMTWNGTAQKYLTEVIPSYLAKIEAGINGTQERYYHEGKGRFYSRKEADKNFNKELRSTYEFGMSEFSNDLKRALKNSNVSKDEADLIMERINASLTNTVRSSSSKQGKNRQQTMGLLKSQLNGKVDDNTIHDLMMRMNGDLTTTMNNLDRFVKTMDTSYRHLFNQAGQKKDPSLDNRSLGTINTKRKYSTSGKLMDDLDEDELLLSRMASENKSKSLRGRAFELKMMKKFGKNWESNSEYKANYAALHPDKNKGYKKVNVIDRGSNKLYDLLSGVVSDDNIDLSAFDEMIKNEAAKKKGKSKGGKNKRSTPLGTTNFIDFDEDTLIDNISSSVSSIVAGNMQASSGLKWDESDHTALTKIIPDKLDAIEKAILKMGTPIYETGRGVSSATGQSSSGLKPSGGSNKFNLMSFNDALSLSSNRLESRANETQRSINGASKGNEAGHAEALSGADAIAQRLQDNENSLSDLVRATNDNFMAPMVGGIFGKEGLIQKFFSKDNIKALGEKLFNEKDGIFKGVGSWFKDQIDYVKYVFTGKGYTNRKGEKFDENKNNVFDKIASGYDWVYTNTLKHFLGEDFRDKESFKKFFSKFDFKAKRDEKRQKRLEAEGNGETSEETGVSLKDKASEVGSKVTEGILKVGERITGKGDGDKQTAEENKKFSDKYKGIFKKYLPGGIAAAIGGGALGMLSSAQGSGAIMPLFFSGGPIAGAVLGVSAMLLSKSEKFKNTVFGEKDEEGNRSGGLISQKTQNFFKKNAPLLIGGAALGALKGVFKTMAGGAVVGGPGGFLMNTLMPGGIIGGAVLGLGVSLLKSSERFNTILFGNKAKDGDEENQSKGIGKKLKQAFAAASPYLKGGLKGAAIGAGAGLALNSMGVIGGALSIGGPVGMGLIGLGLGIASQTDKVKEMLFGTEEFDEDGKSKGRRKNGLLPRLRNYLVLDVFEPLKGRIQDRVSDFAFWLKKNIEYPFRLTFGPIIDSFREIKKNITDTVKNVFENLGQSIGKAVKGAIDIAFKPITNAFKIASKAMIDVTAAGAKAALMPLSLGLKFGQFATRGLRSSVTGFFKGSRTKSLRSHFGDLYRGIKDATLNDWANDQRQYAPGPLKYLDMLFTRGGDIIRNTKQGLDAATLGYNKGMTQQGFNSLGWMNIGIEKQQDKSLKKFLKGDRKTWKGIDEARRAIAQENNHSEIFASADGLKEYKKKLKKAGFEYVDLIQNNNDLNDLIYNKEDFIERLKKGDKNKIKDSNATMNFYQHSMDYQKTVMSKFDTITKAFMKYATQDAIARKKNLTLSNITDIDKSLRDAELTWEDIGVDPGSLTDIATLSDEDWKYYMNERLKPENRGVAMYDDLIRDILERQAKESSESGNDNSEVVERLDALNEISVANARMNASEQMGETGASVDEINKAAGFKFGNRFDDPISRHKKEQERAARRAAEAGETEAIQKGHKSFQDEDEEGKDGSFFGGKSEEQDKKSFFGKLWGGFTGLLGGLLLNSGFWKAAGVATIAGATFGPWAKDIFDHVLKFLDPVTAWLGDKIKDGAKWLSNNMPYIVDTMTKNVVNNMGFIVDSVAQIATSLAKTIGKKAVNSVFKFLGRPLPFPEVESDFGGYGTYDTADEAEKAAKENGLNADGNVIHKEYEYFGDGEDELSYSQHGASSMTGTVARTGKLLLTSPLTRNTRHIPGTIAKGIWKASQHIPGVKLVTKPLNAMFVAGKGIPGAIGKGIKAFGGKIKGVIDIFKPEVVDTTAEVAQQSGIVKKILSKIKGIFKKIGGKAASLLGIKSTKWLELGEKLLVTIEEKFAKNPKIQKFLAENVIKVTTKQGLEAAVLPLTIAFAAYDAVNGSLSAAYLFGINAEDVTGKMRAISSIIEIICGLPGVIWFDLIAEAIYYVTGHNFKQWLAREFYKLISTKAKDKELEDAIDRFDASRELYNEQNDTNVDLKNWNEIANGRRTIGGRIMSLFKKKGKVDSSQYYANDEQLKAYQARKNTKTDAFSSATVSTDSSLPPASYTGVGGTQVQVDDPSNVGFGPGDVKQSDPRWANFKLGKFPSGRVSTMASGGCGPTALSMVANSTSPLAVAQDAKSSGYIKDGGATSDLFTKGAKKYGLNASSISKGGLESALKSGQPTIISGKSSGTGPYTEAGHVVVARGIDRSGNTIVNDPMRGTRKIKASELSKGMRYGWSYSSNAGYGLGEAVGYGTITATIYNAKHMKLNTGSGAMFTTSDKAAKSVTSARDLITKAIERASKILLDVGDFIKGNLPVSGWQFAVKKVIVKLLAQTKLADSEIIKRISEKILSLTTTAIKTVRPFQKGIDEAVNKQAGFAAKFAKSKALGMLVAPAIGLGYGLWNGISGAMSASLLFGIPQEDVTPGMRVISGALSALSGGTSIDILFIIINELFGINAKQWLARSIYEFFGDEDLLSDAIAKMESGRVKYNKEHNTKLTTEEYNQMMNGDTTLGSAVKRGWSKFTSNIGKPVTLHSSGEYEAPITGAAKFRNAARGLSYGIGDVVGYGGINLMSMSNASRQALHGGAPSKGNFFRYNGKRYKEVLDANGQRTWQEMGFFDFSAKYTEIQPPDGFDPSTALSKNGNAKDLVNIDGKTYNKTAIQKTVSNLSEKPVTGAGKYQSAVWNSKENQALLQKLNIQTPTQKRIAETQKKNNALELTRNFHNLEHEPATKANLTKKFHELESDYIYSQDNSANTTLRNDQKVLEKINEGYQLIDGDYKFNTVEFYKGLKVGDLKAMVRLKPDLLNDGRIPKFKAVYNYYVPPGIYKDSRYLRDNELESIFGKSDFLKSLGGMGTEGDYEYKYGFPFYQTTDPRWADIEWRNATVQKRGGDLASLAMIATAYSPNILDPSYIHDNWLEKNPDWYDMSGLKFDKVLSPEGYPAQTAAKVNHKSVNARRLMNFSSIMSYLKNNKPVIMTGYRYKGGPFGGYYPLGNAPLNGPDDISTVVARSANDAYMAVLDPFTTLNQNGVFAVEHLNQMINGKTKAVREAWGITGPSGGGITGKVDLSEKDTSTSDYIDLSGEKGLDKITALFKNVASVVSHLFDAVLGSHEYVSIFDEVEKDGGIDEQPSETDDVVTTFQKANANTPSAINAQSNAINNNQALQNEVVNGLTGLSNVVNPSGKINAYRWNNSYYIKLGNNFYKRISDDEYARLVTARTIMLQGAAPQELINGTARIYGGIPTSTTRNLVGRAAQTASNYTNYMNQATTGMNLPYEYRPLGSNQYSTSPVTFSGIRNWWNRVMLAKKPTSSSTTSIRNKISSNSTRYQSGKTSILNSVSSNSTRRSLYNDVKSGKIGGGNRDLVYGEGDVVGYGPKSLSSQYSAKPSNSKYYSSLTNRVNPNWNKNILDKLSPDAQPNTKALEMHYNSLEISRILQKKKYNQPLSFDEKMKYQAYQQRIQANAPKIAPLSSNVTYESVQQNNDLTNSGHMETYNKIQNKQYVNESDLQAFLTYCYYKNINPPYSGYTTLKPQSIGYSSWINVVKANIQKVLPTSDTSGASGSTNPLATASGAMGAIQQINIPAIIQRTSTAHTNSSPNRAINYLVLHYTAGTSSATGAATTCADYFARPEAGGSADFICDDGSIVQYNPDPKQYFCHAVGGDPYPSPSTSLGAKLHNVATNANSISIEMCSNITPGGNSNDPMDPGWSISEATENNAAGLASKLLSDYNIPFDNMIMHHHVTGKVCPAPYTRNESELAKWEAFKQKVKTGTSIMSGLGINGSAAAGTVSSTTTSGGERDFSKLPSSVQMGAIINASIAQSFGDSYEEAKQHYLEAAYDQYFGAPQTTTTTTTETTGTGTDPLSGTSLGAVGTANLDASNVPQSVWSYFMSKGYGPYGTAGIMGNMNHESGMIVNRKQGDFSSGYAASAQYTQAADSGAIDFVNDSIGYGLVQFTFWSLKKALLDRAKAAGKSVGDLGVQLDEIDSYFNTNGIAPQLKAATSVPEASNIVLLQYERPADQGPGVQAVRAEAGQSFFNQFAGSTVSGANTTSGSSYGPGMYDNDILQKLMKMDPMANLTGKYTKAVGYGGNWLECCAAVKQQLAAQCAAKGDGYNQGGFVTVNVNGQSISVRQDCSGFVGGCLSAYGVKSMENTTTTAYSAGNQELIKAGFTSMSWPGVEGLMPGDILANTSSHVEVYVGNGQVYNAGSTSSILNPGSDGISNSSYEIVWRPADAGAVTGTSSSTSANSTTTSANSTGTTTTTTSANSAIGVAGDYMNPFTRMLNGITSMELKTSDGKVIAFGPGDDNPGAFFTNTLGGDISSSYGKRSSQLGNEYHRGIDISAPRGRKIYSPVSGKVVSSGKDVAGYGNYTVVRDSKGKNHLFAHMNNSPVYGVGDTVNQLDVLGEVGSSGKSTGDHLHYEIRNNGNKYSTIDPMKYKYNETISKSLNIHDSNRRSSEDNSDAGIGTGNMDLQTSSIKDKLNVAINTKNVEDKMDIMIEALQVMVENTAQPRQIASPSITENNTVVYGNGDRRKSTRTETSGKKKNTFDSKEGEALRNIHKTIAKRG